MNVKATRRRSELAFFAYGPRITVYDALTVPLPSL